MVKILYENSRDFLKDFDKLLKKRNSHDSEVDNIVDEILKNVKNRSDKALLEYTKKYDNHLVRSFEDLIVKKGEIDLAFKKIDNRVISSLKHSIRRITSYHKKQLPKDEHPWFFSFIIFTFKVCFLLDLIFLSFSGFKFPKPAADKSLAIPRIPRQSGLFGVIDKSIR